MGNGMVNYCRDGPQSGCKCASCKEELEQGFAKGISPSKKRAMFVKKTYWDKRNNERIAEVQKEHPDFIPIYIDVYDHCHVAVEYKDKEISFNTNGTIYHQKAKHDHGKEYWYQVLVGFTKYTWEEILGLIKQLQSTDFKKGTYNLLGKNCRRFSKKFAEMLCQNGDKQEFGYQWKSKDHYIIGVK